MITQLVKVGIDLGTTFSAIAWVDDSGRPAVVPNADGEPITPSVIYFGEANPIVGSEAKERQSMGEAEVAAFFKRFMGDSNYRLNFKNKDYTPSDLSALILKKLKADAETHLGKSIQEAVITVPAYFNDFQRQATLQAGEQAGLKVLQIVNEPTAAAIAYGLKQSDQNQTVLVYDLGGGTFDVTLIRMTPNSLDVLATDGDHQLGGKDWDDRIATYMGQQFFQEYGKDPLDDLESFNDLLVRCENAKKQLTSREQTPLSITYQGEKASFTLSRESFEQMTDDLMERTRQLTEQVLKEAGLSWTELDGVVLVGGSTRMPMVSDYVTRMSGKKPLSGVNVDEAVALGAAILAHSSSTSAMDTPCFTLGAAPRTIRDVTSHSLGMVATNEDRSKYINSIIIPKNMQIPSVQTRPYQLQTSSRRDNLLEVYMLQGESDKPLDCSILGKYVFSGIEHQHGKPAIIDISYAYDKNGVIQVSGSHRQVNKSLDMKIEPVPTDMSWLGLPPEEEKIASHLSLVISIDLSGSMSGTPLLKAQQAAKDFVEQLDLSHTSVALLIFADQANTSLGFSQNARDIRKGIEHWKQDFDSYKVGGGNETDPFNEALALLKRREDPRFLIVLTDGVWSYQNEAIMRAKACAEAGIEIIAIGFGGADEAFLRRIATSDENALYTDLGGLGGAFSKIAQVLTESGGGLQILEDGSKTKSKGLIKFW